MFWRSPFDYISFNKTRSPDSCQGSLVTALDRFPLDKRCAELSLLFHELPLKELQHYLPTVVEHVFGLGAQPGWGLRGLAHGRPGFDAVRHFLGPEGPLLRLVYRLMSDASLKYDFPSACLPSGVQQSLSTGAVPPFCAGRLPTFQGGLVRPSSLQINAFELYMFHFAYHVVNPSASLTGAAPGPPAPQQHPMLVVDVAMGDGQQQQQRSAGWVSPSGGAGGSEGVYLALVQDYLHYFLPADHENPPDLPGYDQPALFAGASPPPSALHYRDLWGSPGPAAVGPVHRHPKLESCLIRKEVLASLCAPNSPSFHQQQHSGGCGASPAGLHGGSSPNVRVSHCFLEILLEFWLGRQQQQQLSSPAGAMLHHHSFSVMAEEWYVPSEFHVLMVRVLVKYLHRFCYSLRLPSDSGGSSLYACPMQCPMDDVRRAVPQLLRKRLYEFLKQALSCWPLDSSFRLPLETWLSFVQPWRYASPLGRHHDMGAADGQPVDACWQGFVQEQLLFYTELLGLLLPRFCRMDLASRRNSFMLHRVAKVFSQPRLFAMIRIAEEGVGGGGNGSSGSGGGLRPVGAALRQHVADLEEPNFIYRPLCSDQRRAQVAELVRQAVQAWQAVRRAQRLSGRPAPPGWLSVCVGRLSALVSRAPPDEAAERRRTLGHLQAAVQDLCALFQLSPVPEMWDEPGAPLPQAEDEGDDATDSGVAAPGGGSIPGGGAASSPLEYQGNPDTEPIRSYEVVFLVRLLHLLACALNARYGAQLVQLYERPGFAGHVARQLLRPPTTYTEVVKRCVGQPAVRRRHALPPRVCLRLLAHKQLLAYVAAMLLVGHSLGYGLGVVTFVLGLCAALLVLLRATWDWARSLSAGRRPPAPRPPLARAH